MSGLREKLGRLRKSEAAAAAPPPAPEAGGEWAALGAHVETSPAGSFVMRRRVYGADSAHGKYRLRELAGCVRELSCFHGAACAELRIEELLFFDTETTGLGVGAGNVPFLVGIGYYEQELFVVEQLLIRNPAEEHAMLVYLQELFGRFTHIVSYNGRTFDWPILTNRFVLNRLKYDDSAMLQLDLLYPSRSLWRNTLPSCRLSKVEESRLGFERVDDVPGSMAPFYYFQYLAEKDPAVLQGVFIHNEHDIVTLAALAIHFGKLLGGTAWNLEGDEHAACGTFPHDIELEELYRTGLWLEKMGRPDLAGLALDELFARLAEDAAPAEERAASAERQTDRSSAMLLLAAFYKKKGAYERSVALWKRWIASKSSGLSLQMEPYLELAMFYEHKAKDYGQALFYAEEAWAKLWRRRSLQRSDKGSAELEEALERRLKRLREKHQKAQLHAAPDAPGKPAPARGKPRKTRRLKPVYASEGLI